MLHFMHILLVDLFLAPLLNFLYNTRVFLTTLYKIRLLLVGWFHSVTVPALGTSFVSVSEEMAWLFSAKSPEQYAISGTCGESIKF